SNGRTRARQLRPGARAIRLSTVLAARGPLPTRIFYLWGWGEKDGCSAFLAVTQARLANRGSEDLARWLVVTRRAQAVHDSENITPVPAALWGFVRTVQTEQPQWHISMLDGADASLRDPLINELFVAEIEPEV